MKPIFPRFRAVADQAVLVEFGDIINDATHAQVLSLDRKLTFAPFAGFIESVPAYVSLLVAFDAMTTDHAGVELALKVLLDGPDRPAAKGNLRNVEICYDLDFAQDLHEVARQTSLSPDDVIRAHLTQTYQVVMYGFAPGYAYLGGLASTLHLPRKPSAKRGIAAGSVIIAGAQCLVTTLTMPTGWWIIGRSPTHILLDDPSRPFMFDVGDSVRFNRIDRVAFEAKNNV